MFFTYAHLLEFSKNSSSCSARYSTLREDSLGSVLEGEEEVDLKKTGKPM
jgi:hypothetical protein